MYRLALIVEQRSLKDFNSVPHVYVRKDKRLGVSPPSGQAAAMVVGKQIGR